MEDNLIEKKLENKGYNSTWGFRNLYITRIYDSHALEGDWNLEPTLYRVPSLCVLGVPASYSLNEYSKLWSNLTTFCFSSDVGFIRFIYFMKILQSGSCGTYWLRVVVDCLSWVWKLYLTPQNFPWEVKLLLFFSGRRQYINSHWRWLPICTKAHTNH